MKQLFNYIWTLLKEAGGISFTLFKVMIPVVILVKVLQELGVVHYIGSVLKPIMTLVGLPGAMGMAWATALVTNLYGGIVAYLALSADHPLTVAQVTILTSMMLIAHAIPVECRITQKAGVRFLCMGAIRIGAALLYGTILNLIFTGFNLFQTPIIFF